MTAAPEPVVAAGAVLWRPRPGADRAAQARPSLDDIEICLIHRPNYDDWSLPKGKVDRGEHVLTAAVREVEEETGHRVALGPPLPDQRYQAGKRPKLVHYWAARSDDDAPRWSATAEVDNVVFVPAADAMVRLTHQIDAELVRTMLDREIRTTPLVLLRHTAAVERSRWSGDDELRPLSKRGRRDAAALAPMLAAFGVRRVVSSETVRCRDSVGVYADQRGLAVELEPLFSEKGFPQSAERASAVVRKVIADGEPAVICSHRPVLPGLLTVATERSACDVPTDPLPAGGFHVLHHHDGGVVAIESHHV